MTIGNEAELLQEFDQWRNEFYQNPPFPSVEMFLKEREAEANARRIEEALASVNWDGLHNDFGELKEPTRFEDTVYDNLCRIHNILVDDRNVVDEVTFTGGAIRHLA